MSITSKDRQILKYIKDVGLYEKFIDKMEPYAGNEEEDDDDEYYRAFGHHRMAVPADFRMRITNRISRPNVGLLEAISFDDIDLLREYVGDDEPEYTPPVIKPRGRPRKYY